MGDGRTRSTDRIQQDPDILFGKPVIRGTRIPVAAVLEYLADNPNMNDLFADYPRLTLDDIKACFAFAHKLVEAMPREKGGGRSPDGSCPSASAKLRKPMSGLGGPHDLSADLAAPKSPALWEQVQVLQGQSLSTMSGRAVFDILAVDGEKARVLIRGSGNHCNIERRQLEHVWALGLVSAEVTPNDLRAIGIVNPTYAAAILRAVAGEVSTLSASPTPAPGEGSLE